MTVHHFLVKKDFKPIVSQIQICIYRFTNILVFKLLQHLYNGILNKTNIFSTIRQKLFFWVLIIFNTFIVALIDIIQNYQL